jgi:hypothetical protein
MSVHKDLLARVTARAGADAAATGSCTGSPAPSVDGAAGFSIESAEDRQLLLSFCSTAQTCASAAMPMRSTCAL